MTYFCELITEVLVETCSCLSLVTEAESEILKE